jgi:hypothetical protein
MDDEFLSVVISNLPHSVIAVFGGVSAFCRRALIGIIDPEIRQTYRHGSPRSMAGCAPPRKRDAMILSSHGCEALSRRSDRIIPRHDGLSAELRGFRGRRPLRTADKIAHNCGTPGHKEPP